MLSQHSATERSVNVPSEPAGHINLQSRLCDHLALPCWIEYRLCTSSRFLNPIAIFLVCSFTQSTEQGFVQDAQKKWIKPKLS